jgi:DNA-binding transcriptional LysR family regulator
MTIQQIRYFLVLAQELHFWRTSEKVYISQSSLSRQIQMLEDELGIKLLERDKRNVKLTDAGSFLQQRWSVLLDEFDRTHKHAKKINDGNLGNVSIAYPGSISSNFLPEILKVLTNEIPDLKIELTQPADEDHEKILLNYQTDILFSRDRIQNSTILSKKLYSEPICLVVPESHWLNENSFTDLRSVKDENFIISGLHHTTHFASLLRNIFNAYGFQPKTNIESDFGGMVLNLVSRNLGISILPYSYKFSTNHKVRFIKLTEKVDLYINWRKDYQSNTIKKVVDCSISLGEDFQN